MMRLPDYLERDKPRALFRERVLQFVADFQAGHGRSPHQKEIAHGVGISSAGSVWRALKLLEEEGRIKRVRTQIEILRPSYD
jgi:hypothetical protein